MNSLSKILVLFFVLLIFSSCTMNAHKLDVYEVTVIGIIIQACVKIVCFILGFFTVHLGYKLINSGVKGEFNFTGEYKGAKAGLVSSSPGLLFVLLGILLIGYAMYVPKPTEFEIATPSEANTEKTERELPHSENDTTHNPNDTIN